MGVWRLVELGAGFTPDLSARENAVLGAVTLGLSRGEARERVERILTFAGLSEFSEMQLRNFSTGMNMRLAFSVAIQVDADVLLIDEVLAVGDGSFRDRCHEELEQLRDEGRDDRLGHPLDGGPEASLLEGAPA